MPWIWSNPTPSDQTAASMGDHVQIEPTHIGDIVSAILRYRQAQQQERDKNFSNMLSGIASGVSGGVKAYEGQQAQGQADDAANAAIYGQQYPNDSYGGFQNPDKVPDYGGVDALRAQELVHKAQGSTPEMPQLITLPNGQQVLYSPKSGGVHPLTAPGNDSKAEEEQMKAAQALFQNYKAQTGIGLDLMNSQTAVHKGVDLHGKPVPEGQYRIDMPADDNHPKPYTQDVSQGDFDQAHQALTTYLNILKARIARDQPGFTGGASTYVPGAGPIEGGMNDATGQPIVPFQVNPNNTTMAVRPNDPRFGLRIQAITPDGKVITGPASDFGPGVKNVDIASNNPANVKSSPFDNAQVSPTPQQAAQGLLPGTTRVVNGVPYKWDGNRWTPAR